MIFLLQQTISVTSGKSRPYSEVIRKLKAHCARYGLPSIIVSDNGPQFACKEFEEFTKSYDIIHRTSSPGYPKSNGKAESGVKNCKKIISRAMESKQDVNLAILSYRNTPQSDGLSPAQKFLGRRTRTMLPTTSHLMKPQAIDGETMKMMRRLQNAKQTVYYDRYSKDLEDLEEGDQVRIKPFVLGQKYWNKGTVNKKLDERSYEIETDNGILRRNRVHLKKMHTKEAEKDNISENKEQEEMQQDQQVSTPADQQKDEQVKTKSTPMKPPEGTETVKLRRSQRTIKKPNRLDI